MITDEILLLSWDFNNRNPYVITKRNAESNPMYSEFKMLDEVTLLSACNPLYFKPCIFGSEENVFISGDAMAKSPAMLAFLYATDAGVDPKTIRVVSVGSTSQRADKIPENIGIIDWMTRITSLQAPVKEHTHDYLLNFMLMEQSGHHVDKFHLVIPKDEDDQLNNLKNRHDKLIDLKNDFINENRDSISLMLDKILFDKYNDSDFKCVE